MTDLKSLIPSVLAISVLSALIPRAMAEPRPLLGTPDQIAAEKRVLRILQTPRVQAARADVRQKLLYDPAAATAEGRARLDRALEHWLYTLALRDSAGDVSRPFVVWNDYDTPRTWFGHTIPASGAGGDNPDNIYRTTFIDGGSRYEIQGHIPENGPATFSVEAMIGRPGQVVVTTLGKGHYDMGNQVGFLRGEDIKLDAGRNFLVTLDADPANGRPNHIQTRPGPISVELRNSLTDWRQTPTTLSIRRVDMSAAGPVLTDDNLADAIARDLPEWVDFWSNMREGWLGKPPVNTIPAAVRRDGGWGYGTGGRYDLQDDEALVVTTWDAGSRYVGFQVLDRWFMASDSRLAMTSRNNTQVTRNPNGTVTFIVAAKDPGFANWLDTTGSHQGYLSLRWQDTPAGIDSTRLVRAVKLIKIADLASVLPPGFKVVGKAERDAELQQRAANRDTWTK